MEPTVIAIVLVAIMIFAAVSRRVERSIVTMPMVFTAVGWLIGTAGGHLVPVHSEHSVIHTMAEVALILVLFSDASGVDVKALTRSYSLPARMLLIGMPLTILLGMLVCHWVSPQQSWAVALLVAAILTPTDAALGQAVVTSPHVPKSIRQAINVESGLNDGLALPVVVVAALSAVQIAGGQVESAPDNLIMFAVLQVTLGPLTGLLVGFLSATLLDAVIKRELATTSYQGIYFLCVAFLCFVAAELTGGNGLIAAFVGGMTFGNTLRSSRAFITEFMESEGQLFTIVTFVIFGAVMVPVGIEHATWKTVLLAVAFLTLVRMFPVWISLTGTGLSSYEKLFLGWFGPRGLASILFALLILEKYPVPGAEEILACVVLTVMLSIFLHGVSANPLSSRFTRSTEA